MARSFNNMMDFLQLIFGFVNAPLFATFLLGMFWTRTTGHAAFTGLVSGTAAAAATYGFTLAEGKGGWLGNLHEFPSSMAQNFWVAINAWVVCFVVTILVSMVTKAKPQAELVGLVYGVTPHQAEEAIWWQRPGTIAAIGNTSTAANVAPVASMSKLVPWNVPVPNVAPVVPVRQRSTCKAGPAQPAEHDSRREHRIFPVVDEGLHFGFAGMPLGPYG
jgi:antitoxin component of MazEF toxin-antitoxin module